MNDDYIEKQLGKDLDAFHRDQLQENPAMSDGLGDRIRARRHGMQHHAQASGPDLQQTQEHEQQPTHEAEMPKMSEGLGDRIRERRALLGQDSGDSDTGRSGGWGNMDWGSEINRVELPPDRGPRHKR